MGTQPKQRKSKDFLEAKEPIKYWSVELTLTSGKVQLFYVKAKTLHDAYQRADEWSIIYEACPGLAEQGFTLRH